MTKQSLQPVQTGRAEREVRIELLEHDLSDFREGSSWRNFPWSPREPVRLHENCLIPAAERLYICE